MAKLKKLGVLFSAKLQAIEMAVVGLIAGILYSFGGAIYELVTGTLNSGTALAFVALLGMPAVFATFGFVAGAIGAVLYNFVAKRVGTLEIDLEQGGGNDAGGLRSVELYDPEASTGVPRWAKGSRK